MKILFNRFFVLTLVALGAIFLFIHPAQAAYGDVSAYTGKIYDGDGGSRVDAYFDFPEDLDIDASGNFYIADTYNNVIRTINSSGIVSTLAGTGSYGDTVGAATAAEFALPRGVSVGSDGAVYVADTANNKIKKISGSVVTNLVSSGLNGPEGVEVYGSTLFIVDTGNSAIKTVSTSGGTVSTLSTGVNHPKKAAVSPDGSVLYVADSGSYRVLAVNTVSGTVSVVAGSGTAGYTEGVGGASAFNNLWGVAVDGTALYVSDGNGLTDFIRKIDLSTNTTSLFAEDGSMASINFPSGLKVYDGYVYVANAGIGTIHKFRTTLSGDEDIFAGYERFGNRNGAASTALFGRPYDMVMTTNRQYLYVADNNKIRRITRSTGEVAQVIGSSVDNYREGDDDPTHYVGPVRFSTIQGITINSGGNRLYVADRWNNRIRGVNLDTALPYSFLISGAGNVNSTGITVNGYQDGTKCEGQLSTGVSGCAYFQAPSGIVIDPTDTYLYVTDTGNNRIRRVRISDGQTSLVAGSGVAGFANGIGAAAKFNRPFGITIDSTGTNLYVADSNNHAIRKIVIATGQVTTVAGTGAAGYREAIGTQAVLSYPEYVKMGSDGLLYVTDTGSMRIRLVDPATGLTKLIAGSGQRGFTNGGRTVVEFNNPKGLVPDVTGNALYLADTWNDTIRKIDITGTAPYADPAPTVSSVTPKEVNPAWNKGAGLQVKVTGTKFTFGVKTYFADYLAEQTFVQTATALSVKLPLSKLKPGWYDVTVINLDGQRSTLERGLGVTDSKGVTPGTYYPNSTKNKTTISNPSAPSINVASGTSLLAYASTLRGGFLVAGGNVLAGTANEIITGTDTGLSPEVRVLDSGGKLLARFFAYDSASRSGVRVNICDVNGDGLDEIITAQGVGALPVVKIFNGSGLLQKSFSVLDGKFKGGLFLACGDLDGNGTKEIIVTAGRGGGAQVMVYDPAGKAFANFFAYAKTFRGGIRVAAADMDADGRDEIIAGPDLGAPHIQIFKIKTGSITRLSPGFYAFNADYRGGVSVAGVDTNGDGIKELVVGVGSNATPLVRIFNIKQQLQKQFYAFLATFTGGVNVSGSDTNGDGTQELLVAPRSAGGPQVRIIDTEKL
ncbi:MAG: hypothetical protein WCT27_00045 [Patescibacteria group bacterium]